MAPSIQAALAGMEQKTNLGLAHFNFDFSLLKLEAPPEYRDLGAALSTKRRFAAESGNTHITARKLGALFEQILPSTPSLFKAYGLRASEIAQHPSVNPKGNRADGPFAEHTGVDGTNIWAAATSGKGAVAMHLLACMLSRIWKASEAVGIWEEILQERKRELSTFDEGEAIPVRNLDTGLISLSREQLAEWDASARAWLRSADEAKRLNHTQLSLILNNLDIPVNTDCQVYASVMQAWKNAMTIMDKLVEGVSHGTNDGAVLLGLSAWHLYPDLLILGTSTKEVHQRDPLIAVGGTVTIGLSREDTQTSLGVYWSLPLANVRYYGDPVTSVASVSSDASRISMSDLFQVTLGSLIAKWGILPSQATDAANLFRLLWETCNKEGSSHKPISERIRERSWLKLLADAAGRYLESSGHEEGLCKRLLGLGQRQSSLMGRSDEIVPIFGLTDTSYVKILKPEHRVHFLRTVARSYGTERDVFVIRSFSDSEETALFKDTNPSDTDSLGESSASAIPLDTGESGTTSWAEAENRRPELLAFGNGQEYYGDARFVESLRAGLTLRWVSPPAGLFNASFHTELYEKIKRQPRFNRIFWSLRSRDEAAKRIPVATFAFLCGDIKTSALYRLMDIESSSFRRLDQREIKPEMASINLEQLVDALRAGIICPARLLNYLNSPEDVSGLAVSKALQGLATAAMVYSFLPHATIALGTVQLGPMDATKWYNNPQGRSEHLELLDSKTDLLLPLQLSRAATFACISMFESGSFNPDPELLQKVMAISAGDSIYVAAPLLCDPAIVTKPYEIRRIVGNIGRAGIAFLIPPINPMIKKLALETYQIINHDPYDGKLEDSYQNTTLHLDFSGYEFALDVGDHGRRHREAFFIESRVAVHDHGAWIADIDPLSTFDSENLHIAKPSPCRCAQTEVSFEILVPDTPLISIDRWEELLESPLDAGVVRSRGNWLARLAAAAIGVKTGHRTILLSGTHCRKCCGTAMRPFDQQIIHGTRLTTRKCEIYIL